MIGAGINTIRFQNLSQFFHFLTAQTIDNTRFTGITLDELNDILVYIIRFTAYLIIKIRSIERRLELIGIRHSQDFLDILTHFLSSSSCQCNNRSRTNHIDNRTDTSVLRTEVVTPFRDTMCLIYGIERNLHILQEFHILFLGQRFGSHIKQLGLSIQDVRLYLINRRLVQRGIQEVCDAIVFAIMTHGIHLILHQSNQRRNNNGHPVHNEGRQLIT